MSSFIDRAANVAFSSGLADMALDAFSPAYNAAKNEWGGQADQLRAEAQKINIIAIPILITSVLIMAASSGLFLLGFLGAAGASIAIIRALNISQMATNMDKMADRIATYVSVTDGRIQIKENAFLDAFTEGCFFQSWERDLCRPIVREQNARLLGAIY